MLSLFSPSGLKHWRTGDNQEIRTFLLMSSTAADDLPVIVLLGGSRAFLGTKYFLMLRSRISDRKEM